MSDPLFWLYADNYRTYNIEVARKLGSINAAILLSELAGRYNYHKIRGELYIDKKHGGDWFYHTIESIEDRTCLTRKNQDTAYLILESAGLIEKKIMGIPAKRYFRIKSNAIMSLFFTPNDKPSLPETDKQPSENETNCSETLRQTHIYKEPKEEPNKEREVCAHCSSISQSKAKKEKTPKRITAQGEKISFGEHQNVEMTQADYDALVVKHGKLTIDRNLSALDEWIGRGNGTKERDHYLTLTTFIRREKERTPNDTSKASIQRKSRDDHSAATGGGAEGSSNLKRY